MIRHLLKLVWHRKRANALITIEIFACFLIVFVVSTFAVSLWSRWHSPLGFEWRNVWDMSVVSNLSRTVSASHDTPDSDLPELARVQQRAADVDSLVKELRSFSEVEAVGATAMPPYAQRTWTTILEYAGRRVDMTADNVTDGFAKAMQLKVVEGRWFQDDDETQNYEPIVIDRDASRALFGSEDPIGKKIPARNFFDDPAAPKDLMVVGVIAPYRKDGEFTATKLNMVFFRVSRRFPSSPEATEIVIRLRPGTPASFESTLNDRLRPSATDVRYRLRRMEDMRRGSLRIALTPIAALGIIAVFLISMVALGLTGVLWQTVTRRTREIGLRRAVGASARNVRRQVLGEVAVLVTLAAIAGAAVIAQLPLLGLFRVATPADFAGGFAAALLAIYGITLLCGAYPSWLASTIEPADALHYE